MGTIADAKLEGAPPPASAIAEPDRFAALICHVRSGLCVLPIAHVVETMCPLPIEPVGAMPLFVRGMSVIRGAAVPVVDLGALLGVPEPAATTRFITLRAGARSVALAVEGIAGVRSLGAAELHPLPLFLRGRCDRVAPAVGLLEADLLFVLRAARILPDSVWRALPPADGEARG